MKYFLLLLLCYSSFSFSQDLLPLFSENPVVFYGEEHYTQEHHEPLLEALERGVESGVVKTFATEYVPAQMQPAFDAYLTSPTAVPGSEEEKIFFEAFSRDWGLMWPKFERNRSYYRHLRRLKLKHGDGLKICGIDYQDPKELRTEPVENDELGPGLSAHVHKVYTSLPLVLQKKFEELSGKTIKDLSRSVDEYYREGAMAASLHQCAGSSSGVLVHTGGFHNHSARAPVEVFWTLSRLYGLLAPGKFTTVMNLRTYTNAHPEDDDFRKMNRELQIDCDLSVPVIVPREAFPEGLAKILKVSSDDESFDFTQVWDHFILGPEATEMKEP